MFNLDNRHPEVNLPAPVGSSNPNEENELVTIYDDARPVFRDQTQYSNLESVTVEPARPPSVHDRVTVRQRLEHTDLPITMNDNESTSYSEIATLHTRPTAVEMSYSPLESSTREPPRPPAVYDRVTVRQGLEHTDMPITMNDNESTNYAEIATLPARPTAVEMPYSRLESSTRELPRPPAVYDRLTRRRDVEPL